MVPRCVAEKGTFGFSNFFLMPEKFAIEGLQTKPIKNIHKFLSICYKMVELSLRHCLSTISTSIGCMNNSIRYIEPDSQPGIYITRLHFRRVSMIAYSIPRRLHHGIVSIWTTRLTIKIVYPIFNVWYRTKVLLKRIQTVNVSLWHVPI